MSDRSSNDHISRPASAMHGFRAFNRESRQVGHHVPATVMAHFGCAARGWFGTLVMAVLLMPSRAALADDASTIIARIKQSVVAVGTFERTRAPQFLFRGTGFSVDDGTLIVTNAHVIPGRRDGDRNELVGVLVPQPENASAAFREARLVAMDPGTDLALLKVGGTPLPALPIGDSDAVKEGQSIMMTGFPIGAVLGPYPATHRGMIAAVTPIAIPQAHSGNLDAKVIRRLAVGSFNVFQLDATAYPGNSGSPIYDASSGAVIGIVNMVFVKGTKESALSQPSGITYAVPSKYLLELMQKSR